MLRAPNDVEHVLARATEAATEGRDADARRLARYALSLAPDDPRALFRWAVENVDDPDQALYYLRRAARLAGDDPSIEYEIACVLLELGEIEESLRLAKLAGRHVESDFGFLPGLVNLAGRIADAKGDAVVAEQALRLAYAMQPDVPWHAASLAKFLAAEGRSSEALRVVRAALDRTPDHPSLLRLRGRIPADGGSQRFRAVSMRL